MCASLHRKLSFTRTRAVGVKLAAWVTYGRLDLGFSCKGGSALNLGECCLHFFVDANVLILRVTIECDKEEFLNVGYCFA